jgi:NADH-quinone oxidoreductase subunit M
MFAALAIDTLLLLSLWDNTPADGRVWLASWSTPWISVLGANIALAVDGMALLLCLLTCGIGMVTLLALKNETRHDPGWHALCFMSLLACVLGVFLSTDLLLFFIFFEFMLLPSCALIGWWGQGGKTRTAVTFFLYTQAGGLLMLVAIAVLHVAYFQGTGFRSFDYALLSTTLIEPTSAMMLLACFLAAFLVKLPVAPVHLWQPAAYADAPPETSILLSALMAKTAGFGLLRFAVPMFPEAAASLAPAVMAIGATSIIYCAWTAFGQTDLKKLIAYSSAGHLAFVLLAAFSMNDLAQKGAVILMVAHGLSVTGLFLVAWLIESATGTREMYRLGGLWSTSPVAGRVAMVFVMATLGLPGLANFVGEFIVLLGVFQASPAIAAIAAVGTVLSAAYALRILQLVFFGTPHPEAPKLKPAASFGFACAILVAALIFIGAYPGPLLNRAWVADIHPVQVIELSAAPAAEAGERP